MAHRKSSYRKIVQCRICGHTQGSKNGGVCEKCGFCEITEVVARWVETTTFWESFTMATSGYWEIKKGKPPRLGKKGTVINTKVK